VRLGSIEDRIQNLDKAITLHPESPELHWRKGNALDDLERHEEAMKEYDEAIRLEPTKSTESAYHYDKGNTLCKLGRYEEAIKEYDEAIKLNPNNPTLMTAYNHNRDVALRRYKRAILREEEDYHENKGIELLAAGKYDDAIKEFEKANSHRGKGDALSELGRYDEALAEYDKAIYISDDGVLHNNKAYCLARMKRFSQAATEINISIQMNPSELTYRITSAEIHAQAGNRQEGLEVLDKSVRSGSITLESLCKALKEEVTLQTISQAERDMLDEYLREYCNDKSNVK
jgi:tetratricopeptide (TPR) repeat protein